MIQWSRITGVASAVVSSTTFGLIPLFTLSLLALGVGSPTILAYRFLLAAVAMAIVMLFTRRNFRLALDQAGARSGGGACHTLCLDGDTPLGELQVYPEWRGNNNPLSLSTCRNAHHGVAIS